MERYQPTGEKHAPFYFLKCEYEDNRRQRGSTKYDISNATCTLRVFGKNETGGTISVELSNYQPDFFVSFRDRDVCARNLRRITERLRQYVERLAHADDNTFVECCHIKGIETATGYNSLIIYKDHQDRGGSEGYGDTRLAFTFRVYVRCFSHIRPAIRELLEIARDTAVECGSYSGISSLQRDIHFYESSLDANIRLADRLKLRPCQWCWLNTNACKKAVTEAALTARTKGTIEHFTYDFSGHVNKDVLRTEKRMEYVELPFAEATDELRDKLPPPVSVMSFDIECLANDINTFPTPDVCGIIQIATVIAPDALNRTEYNAGGAAVRRCLYTVNDCDTLDEVTTVKCFDSEHDMLAAFCSDLVAEDPDILTGYYIENFDLPFLFARLSHHRIPPVLGRFTSVLSSCEKAGVKDDGQHTTKRYASYMPKSNITKINGRTVFDACVFVRKEFSLRSYTLNAVSEHFLKSRKEDVHYTQIPSLFRDGAQGRAVLGRYCVKDAQLVMDLVFHLQVFATMYERCKVFNTTLDYMLDRGQQVRIISMLLQWCSKHKTLINDCTTSNEVFFNAIKSDMQERLYERNALDVSNERRRVKKRPSLERRASLDDIEDRDDQSDSSGGGDDNAVENCGGTNDDGGDNGEDRGGKTKNTRYDGAVVIEPKRGLYYDPIVCLDYASLYPSIMIAYNLCYSTMILNVKHGQDAFENGEAFRSPVGHYFLKPENKKGVLPSILETLLTSRSAVRKRMAGLNQDSIDYMLLNGQQGALKIASNSIYGATGCQTGKLYFLQIPSSVTAYGREMIVNTKDFIEKEYPDRYVVYGDTDSVMVRLAGWTTEKKKHLWECTDAGDDMAESVTRLIGRRPIRLQFETVYLPFLLANKKRYASGVYKSLDDVKRLAETEGVEAAQRALANAERRVTCKGLEVVRRDNCLFTKNTLQKTIDMIMDMEPKEHVVGTLRQDILRLLRGEVNIRDLIISKEWSKRTKNPTPHDRLAQKMLERNPGEAPRIGDRIQYIVTKSPEGTELKMCDRAEDPLYVLENGLAIDYIYYADNQLLNPLVNVLAIAMPESTKEEIKDMLWPSATHSGGMHIPERPSKKRATGSTAKRSRRITKHNTIPPNNRLITSYFVFPKGGEPSDTSTDSQPNTETAKDIEDICLRLERECLSCKEGDIAATASCKNRDCALLYDRFTQKRRIKTVSYDVRDKEYAKVLGFV